jgi:hypothetical protein
MVYARCLVGESGGVGTVLSGSGLLGPRLGTDNVYPFPSLSLVYSEIGGLSFAGGGQSIAGDDGGRSADCCSGNTKRGSAAIANGRASCIYAVVKFVEAHLVFSDNEGCD